MFQPLTQQSYALTLQLRRHMNAIEYVWEMTIAICKPAYNAKPYHMR